MSGVLMGLDVGTTAAKVVATTPEGETVAHGRAPIDWTQTADGTEIDAGRVLAAVRTATAHALEACGGRSVLALGVASMGESGVLIDSVGRPIAPIIAWHDTRDHREVAELAAEIGEKEFAATTGLPVRSQWSLTKHRWQVRHWPQTRAAVRRLSVAEWVVRAFGGGEVSEQSLASRTGWLGLHDRAWWPDAMNWSDLSPTLLPDLVVAGTAAGRVTRADGLGALEGAVLTVAGHDHQAAAVGACATQVGDVLDSCGTAEALVRTLEPGLDADAVTALAEAGITTGWHALSGHWCLLGGTQGGLALQRVLGMLGLDDRDIARLDFQPDRETNVEVHGIDEREQCVHGIGSEACPGDVWRAALRAVTARSAAIHDAMSEVAGQHRDFVVTGGWARSSGLLAAKEAHFGVIRVAESPEAGAHGAARFAGVAAGILEHP